MAQPGAVAAHIRALFDGALRVEDLRDLEYWRLSLISWSRAVFVVGFPISLTLVIPQFWAEGRYGLIALDVVFFAVMLVLMFLRRSYRVQAIGISAVLYAMATMFLYTFGPTHARPVWLLVAGLSVAVFHGLRGAMVSILVSALVLLGVYAFADPTNPAWAVEFGRPVAQQVVFLVNYLVIQTVAVLAIGYLLDKLDESLRREREQHDALLGEQAENHRLELELEHSRRLDALGKLAAGLAHDLNNMLVPIMNLTELTRAGLPEDSDAHADLGEVIQASERASQLCADMLAFGRQIGPLDQIVDLSALGEEVLRQRRASAPTNLELRLVAQTQPRVLGNEQALHRVLSNLVGNAVHASGETGGLIEVRLQEQAGQVTLEVADQGTGIPAELLARIFDPFFTTKGKSGTGLGLATVHGIVHALGGAIEVDSTVGEGTCFRITLRAAPPDRAQASGSTSA